MAVLVAVHAVGAGRNEYIIMHGESEMDELLRLEGMHADTRPVNTRYSESERG